MLLTEIKNIKSTKKDWKNFGLTAGITLIIFSFLLWWREKEFYFYFLLAGLILILLGLLIPLILKPLQKIWLAWAIILGWLMTRIILSVFFYLIFTLIGLTLKLSGKQLLEFKNDQTEESYWHHRAGGEFKKSDYERQF